MQDQVNTSFHTRLLQIGLAVALLLFMVFALRSMMFGSKSMVGVIIAGFTIAAAVLSLDRYYWVVYPAVSSSGLVLPGIPLTSHEMGCVLLVTVYFIRSALKKSSGRATSTGFVWLAFPYFFWTIVVFLLNPVGLHMFGAGMIGGRHYFRIVLGFMTLVVLSRIEFSEEGLKWLFRIVIVCSLLAVIRGYFGLVEDLETMDLETRSRYYLIPFGTIVSILLCRFDLPVVLTSFKLLAICAVCSVLVLLSGKRSTVGILLATPFVLAFLRRRGYGATFVCGVIGAFAVGVLVLGHGRFFELPYSMQRGLSFLPGNWDRGLDRYGFNDDFRTELHRRAKDIIWDSPLLGRRGYAMDPREISWIMLYRGARDTMFAGHELAGNWHNKFWGMWADFGVVAPFSWYGFMIIACFWAFRKRDLFLDHSYASTFYRFWFCSMFFDLVLAYGHSSMTPFERWQTFGMLLALNNMKKAQLAGSELRQTVLESDGAEAFVPEDR